MEIPGAAYKCVLIRGGEKKFGECVRVSVKCGDEKKLICGPKDIKCPIKLFSIRGKVFSVGSSF
jgi:hypothetical protein